jgi:hypothetical protein
MIVTETASAMQSNHLRFALGISWISNKLPYKTVGQVAQTHVWPPQDKHKGPKVNGKPNQLETFFKTHLGPQGWWSLPVLSVEERYE